MKWTWLFVVGALLGVTTFVAYGCGTDNLAAGPSGPGTGASSGNPIGAGPCTDGQVRDCHRILGQTGKTRTCAYGTQTCGGGVWGDCGGSTQSVKTLALPPGGRFLTPSGAGGGGLSTLSLTDASADAGICTGDPCDPYCVGWDECTDGGACAITAEAGVPGSFGGNPSITGIPPGQLGNLFNDGTYGGPGDSCTLSPMFSKCQADSYCWPERDKFAAGKNILNEATAPNLPPGNYDNCTFFQNGNHYTTATCAGVNLTVQVGCAANGVIPAGVPAGDHVIGVCNRGDSDMPPTTGVGLTFTNGPGSGLPRNLPPTVGCYNGNAAGCTVDFPAGIKSGQCIPVDLNTTGCGAQSGLKYYAINVNSVVAECAGSGGFQSPFLATPQVAQVGCADNWGGVNFSSLPTCASYGVPAPAYSSTSQVYQAVCSNPSTAPQWTIMTYDTGGSVSAFSDLSGTGELVITAATSTDGVTYGTTHPIADACNTTALMNTLADAGTCTASTAPPPTQGDPGQCLLNIVDGGSVSPNTCPAVPDAGGPYGPCCPKSLYNLLGATEALNPYLKLTFTIHGTPDGLLAPSVKAWQVGYSCVPSQ